MQNKLWGSGTQDSVTAKVPCGQSKDGRGRHIWCPSEDTAVMPVRVVRTKLRGAAGEPSFPQNPADPFPAQLCQVSMKLLGWRNATTGLCSEQGTAQAGQLPAKNSLKETFLTAPDWLFSDITDAWEAGPVYL